jgi:phosphoglycolate phosphatase-like HAD superfamily hydrolase
VKLLALDFDGVISDSAREGFVVALRAYRTMWPGAHLPEVADADDAPGLYRAFVDLMPLGNRAEDYAVVLAALEQGHPLAGQSSYDAFFAAQDPAELGEFHRRFYEVRDAWAARDPDGWLDQMKPYPRIREVLRRHAGEVILAIATAKDRASVGRLLQSYGIDDLFPPERVLDKEAGRSKRGHLEALAARTGTPLPEILFVDDKLNHLGSVRSLGVGCALAAWGYNGSGEQALARSAGYRVLTLEALESQLFAPA